MVVLDTSAIAFDALQLTRLSRAARSLIEQAHAQVDLACCGISLREIAMLVASSDTVDRLVAATAVFHRATLITTDGDLRRAGLPIKVIKLAGRQAVEYCNYPLIRSL